MPDQTPTAHPGRGHHLSRWLVAIGVLVAAAGVLAWQLQGPAEPASGSAATPPGGSESSAPATGTTAKPVPAPWRPGAPVRVRIPVLGVDAPVQPVGTRDDTLVPPADPTRLGWWAEGAKPGARTGSALVTGHTVHTGGGALDDLETVEPGDRVVVRTRDDTLRYVVRQVRVFSKGTVADHAERLFSQDVRGRLVLVTCEDWDGSRYLSNVVVVATPQR